MRRENYTTRDLWKDKKLIMLDAAGKTYHLDGFWWHHPHKSLEDKCIDIAHDTQHFRQKHFLDDCK